MFGKRAKTLADMVKKGDRVGISGELTNRKYQDKNGVEKYSLDLRVNDLTLLGGKDDAKPQYNQDDVNERQRSKVDTSMPMEDIESDLPF